MRRRTLLTFVATVAAIGLAPRGSAQVVTPPTLPDTTLAPGPTTGAMAGTRPLVGGSAGATLLLHGNVTDTTFTTDSVVVRAGRLATRTAPDEFRVILGTTGGALDTLRLWSPLRIAVWDSAGRRERIERLPQRRVAIAVPLRPDLESIVLQWPRGGSIARIVVGDRVRAFCAQNGTNASCRTTTLPIRR